MLKLETDKKLLITSVCLLWVFASFYGIKERTLDNHEAFVSVAAREMLVSGDLIVPTLNGAPRLQKPPLMYWLAAFTSFVTGPLDEFTARFPSAVFGIFSALAMLFFVSRWHSTRTGILSACIWATSYGFIRWSHNARAEMVMCFFTTLCLLVFYDLQRHKASKDRKTLLVVFWLSFAFANFAKGPIPFTVVFIPIITYAIIRKKWQYIKRLHIFSGLLFVILAVLPWLIMVAYQVEGAWSFWNEQSIGRFGGFGKGDYPIDFYSKIMFKYMFPWAAFLPVALFAPFYKVWNKKRPLMVYSWVWFATGIIFLTICSGKRQHYILPLMPAMSIMVGIIVEDLIFIRKAYSLSFAKNILRFHLTAIALVSICGLFFISVKYKELLLQTGTLFVLAAGAAILFVLLLYKGKLVTASILLVSVTLTLGLSLKKLNTIIHDENRRIKQIALEAKNMVPVGQRLIAYKKISSPLVHYYGTVIPMIKTSDELNESYENGDWIIMFGSVEKYVNSKYEVARLWAKDPKNDGERDMLVLHNSKNKDS